MSPEPDSTLEFSQPVQGEEASAAAEAASDAGQQPRAARLTLYAGIFLVVIGWLVLYLGYNGAATNPQTPAQMPYLLSGGFGGLGLILLGAVLILANVIISGQAAARAEVREVADAIAELTESLSRLVLPGASLGSSNGVVVAARGSSSYHKPDCRLVGDAARLQHLTPVDASRKGLAPCRVCKPG